jgi:hypothetical protein
MLFIEVCLFQYGLSLSSDQHSVVGGGGNSQIRHSNPVIHLNNRNSPDIANLLHQARTNSQDSETNKEPIAPSHALSDSNDLPELPDVQNGSGEQVTENEDEPPYDSENAVNFSSQYFDAEIQAINDELEKARYLMGLHQLRVHLLGMKTMHAIKI